MEELTNLTQIKLEFWQFATIVVFLIANTAAIIGAWYRYGYRISTVEKEHKDLKETVEKLLGCQEDYITKDQYIEHLQETKETYTKVTNTLNEVKQMMITLQGKVDIHLAIHDEREKPVRNPRVRK